MIDLRDFGKLTVIPISINDYNADDFPEIPCVYFLFNSTRIMYIGQTKNIRKRLYGHCGLMNFKDFDSVGFVKIDRINKRLSFEEKMTVKYLRYLYPPYNINLVEKVYQ